MKITFKCHLNKSVNLIHFTKKKRIFQLNFVVITQFKPKSNERAKLRKRKRTNSRTKMSVQP